MKTGCEILNELIGEYKDEISLIYGVAGSGKTTIAKLAAIEKAKNSKVVFIDTENGFSVERFKQLVGDDYKELLKNIFVVRVDNFKEQCKKIEKLLEIIDLFDLVIIDTIGYYYRKELKDDVYKINKGLDTQLKILAEITRKGKPVILTNQVYSDFNGKINIVGGNMLKNWCKCLIELENKPRKIKLLKPEKKVMKFEIKKEGIFKKEE